MWVAASTVMSKNWKDFLCIDENKTEFVCLPVTQSCSPSLGKELYAIDGSVVLCSPAESCLARYAPCSSTSACGRCCAKGV